MSLTLTVYKISRILETKHVCETRDSVCERTVYAQPGITVGICILIVAHKLTLPYCMTLNQIEYDPKHAFGQAV